MDMLQVHGKNIVDASGRPITLKGFCLGGWMNMEDFIIGYPGSEEGIRHTMAETVGDKKAEVFFDTMLDYMFNEDDAKFMSDCGANSVRIALNYRHFENDLNPFQYLEKGFKRLDKALDWFEKYNIYVFLDLHSVQGWQSPDWHCDNPIRRSLFWDHPHFQDRCVELWKKFAQRYKNRSVIAGYDLMNEPVTNAWRGRIGAYYYPNWDAMNSFYKRIVTEIRKIDSKHIICMEGDNFSGLFSGLEKPFTDNLVYSSHNYIDPGMTGSYPGYCRTLAWWSGDARNEEVWWDMKQQKKSFYGHEGTNFVQKHNVPLWVSEFGSSYAGAGEQIADRMRSLDDQLTVFDEFGAHWSVWTYKDLGIIGSLMLDPESEYMKVTKSLRERKEKLNADFGVFWLSENIAKEKTNDLADYIESVINEPYVSGVANRRYLGQAVFSEYSSDLMQRAYASIFKDMTEEQMEKVLQSFLIKNCIKNKALINVLKKHFKE